MSDYVCPLDYRYGREEMKSIFSETSRINYQMKVEAALARAHATLGEISQADADEITRVAESGDVKVERIKEIEKLTNHDLMAMVKAMTEQCKGDAGKYVHLGATSNDIVDTATAMQIRDALALVAEDVQNAQAHVADAVFTVHHCGNGHCRVAARQNCLDDVANGACDCVEGCFA